jgi:4-amino-4-deoxy-L-arabinose transferase-like glycosyltransferase
VQERRERWFVRWLTIWVIVALALRLVNLVLPDPPSGDDASYIAHAVNLLSGDGFHEGGVYAYRCPGYVGFLAAVFAVCGEHRAPVVALQAVLGAATVLLLALVVRRRLGDVAALFAAAAMALYVPFVRLPGRLYTENLAFLLLVIIWWLMERPGGRLRYADAVIAGLLTGLAVLTREVFAAMALAYVLVRLLSSRPVAKDWGPLAAFVVCMVLAVSPWTVRNYLLFDRFVPVTTNGWTNIYMGFNDLADGLYTGNKPLAIGWDSPPPESERTSKFLEISLADAQRKAVMEFWRERPGRSLALVLTKLGYAWGPQLLLQVEAMGRVEELAVGVWTGMYFVLVLLGLYGFWRGALPVREHPWPYALLVVPTLCMLLTVVVARYRFPTDVALIVFASNGYIALLSRAARKRGDVGEAGSRELPDGADATM